MISQGILVELNAILFQWGSLVFWVPNWFCGGWYHVHCVRVRIFGVVWVLFEGSGFGFGSGFSFGFGFGFVERIVYESCSRV
jgi:hypothetical protein